MELLFLFLSMFINVEYTPSYLNKILNSQSIVESNNKPNAIGDVFSKNNYSVGLHQIRLRTANWIIDDILKKGYKKNFIQNYRKKYGIKKLLLNPYINRYLAKKFLIWLYNFHNKNWKQAIISYNTGPWANKKVRNILGLKYYKKIKKYI